MFRAPRGRARRAGGSAMGGGWVEIKNKAHCFGLFALSARTARRSLRWARGPGRGFRFPLPRSGLPFAKFSAPDAVRLKIWTAAPAPPRLFLPQAAPRLRSLWPSGATDGPSGPDSVKNPKLCALFLIESPRVAVPCFCFGRHSALAKSRPRPLLRLAASAAGSARLRSQRRLPVSSTGRGRRRCPRTAGAYNNRSGGQKPSRKTPVPPFGERCSFHGQA